MLCKLKTLVLNILIFKVFEWSTKILVPANYNISQFMTF
jgi:hypothetical protein